MEKYSTIQVKLENKDILAEVKRLARKEFDERRSCQRSEIQQYVKSICELQRAVKSLKSQFDRLESQLSIK